MTEPVSVVITCYNLRAFIEEAVDSVRMQRYQGDVQLIVVDDCSTDGSREILQSLTGITLVLQPRNGGVMNAMLAGLREAKNDVVFFLDGDDVWHPSKIALCMDKMGQETVFCTHDLWYMDGHGQPSDRSTKVSEILDGKLASEQQSLIRDCILGHLDYVWLGSAFGIRRSLSRADLFLRFCEQKGYLRTCYQDWPLAVWVALHGTGKFQYVEEKLFGYRIHANNYSGASQTRERLERNLTKSRDTCRLILEMMQDQGVEPRYRRASADQLAQYSVQLAAAGLSRIELAKSLVANARVLMNPARNAKVLVRAALSLLMGADASHGLLERLKRRSSW